MADTRPWALHVTRNLPPLLGGMERLNRRLAGVLAENHQLVVVGPAGCRAHLPDGIVVREVPIRPLVVFLVLAWAWVLIESLAKRPRWVVAGSGLTAPIAWLGAKLVGARSMTYVHGLDLVVRQPHYQRFWMPAIRGMDVVVANSRNTAELARSKQVPGAKVRVVNPGAEPEPLSSQLPDAFREEAGLSGKRILLSVGRLTPRKGVRWFVEHCLPDLRKQCPDVVLLVIGGDARDALLTSAQSERGAIEEAARRVGVEQALRFLPPCDDPVLIAAYQACDVHIFPIVEVEGDIEGFGMVAVEAAMAGLPTVAFSVGGVTDAVVPGVTGDLIAPGDARSMNNAVRHWLEQGRHANVRKACVDAASRWRWSKFDAGILELLRGEEGRNE